MKNENFEIEIGRVFLSGSSFFAYRYPGDTEFHYGISEGYLEGIGTPGFVIGMFSPYKPIITIPYHHDLKTQNPVSKLYRMPEKSTTYEEYSREVEGIIAAINAWEGKKVVAARVIVEDSAVNVPERFYELCQRFPDAFVFCFATPATGCWIGASPELLLEGKNGIIGSMALAGTRAAGTAEPWDEKNKEEQKIVVDYISDIFHRNGLISKIGDNFTKKAGLVEHICTEIMGIRDGGLGIGDWGWLERLLRDLSPTPALCGYPKDFALNEIRRYEHFDRGCYGGFCGPFQSVDDFRFNVVIRCAAIAGGRQVTYVGGGITGKSEVAEEWKETEIKYQSIKL